MRVESENNGRTLNPRGLRAELLRDFSVPEVHPVKIANRHRSRAEIVRQSIQTAN